MIILLFKFNAIRSFDYLLKKYVLKEQHSLLSKLKVEKICFKGHSFYFAVKLCESIDIIILFLYCILYDYL